MELGDYTKASEYLQKAISLSEDNLKLVGPDERAVFYTNLAYLYIKEVKSPMGLFN